MKPKSPIRIILTILAIGSMILGIASLYFWIQSDYQVERDALERWTLTQNAIDHKWAWDVPNFLHTIVPLTAAEILLLWGIVYYFPLRSGMRWIVKNKYLGPATAVIIACLLFGPLCILGFEIYHRAILTFDPSITLHGCWLWLSGPYAGLYPRKEMATYFYFVLAPTLVVDLLALSALYSAIKESIKFRIEEAKYAKKSKS